MTRCFPMSPAQEAVRAGAAQLAGPGVAVEGCRALEVWQAPDGRVSVCLRLNYKATRRALSRAGAVHLHESVKSKLALRGVELRINSIGGGATPPS